MEREGKRADASERGGGRREREREREKGRGRGRPGKS